MAKAPAVPNARGVPIDIAQQNKPKLMLMETSTVTRADTACNARVRKYAKSAISLPSGD
jgi:hypothetical protein